MATERDPGRDRVYDARRGSSTARGYDARWQRIRAYVLRLHPGCNRCPNKATEVHHIEPIEQGGAVYDLSNLEPLCHACHMQAEREREREGRSKCLDRTL